MNRKLAITLAAGALVFGVPRSEATQITGTVGFTGSFSGAPLNLANATSISFVNPKVQTVEAGSILDLYIDVGDSASIASPLNVAGGLLISVAAEKAFSIKNEVFRAFRCQRQTSEG